MAKLIEGVLERIDIRLVIVTGGEPLSVMEELAALLDYCKSRGIETGIFSNGTLATSKNANAIKGKLDWARISLNGSCPEVHEKSYPRGTFGPAVAGIRNLRDAGIKVKVRTTISKMNRADLPAFVDFVAGLNVAEIDFRPYLPLGDCNPHDGFMLEPEELLHTAAQLVVLRERYPHVKIKLLPGWFDFLASDAPTGQAYEECHCGRQYLYVDVDGVIAPCAGHRMKVGHYENGSLEELWRDAPVLQEMRGYEQADYCQPCPSRIQCHRSSCSLINYEVHRNFSVVNPMCPVFKIDPSDTIAGHAAARKLFREFEHAERMKL